MGPAKARYSVVIITDSGRSRQIDLTPFRLRMGIAGVVTVLVLVAVAGALVGSYGTNRAVSVSEGPDLLKKVKSLEEELQVKELAVAAQKKRLEELERDSSSARASITGERRPESDAALSTTPPVSREERVAARPGDSRRGQEPWALPGSSGESEAAPLFQPPAAEPTRPPDRGEDSGRVASRPSGTQPGEGESPLISFNAQQLMAVPGDNQDETIISFRLVKDHPNIRFVGYMFVYLEIQEGQERRLIVYPADASLGEGHLPKDYKQGKGIRFRYNSTVQVPYQNAGTGSSLTGISILLYDRDGAIVFQRGFERAEITSGSPESPGAGGGTPSESSRRRRAL